MAKAEWGSKHECPNCSTRFYDMLKPSPLTCPNCDFVFATDVLHRLRKGKSLKSLMDDASEEEAEVEAEELPTADESQTDAEMLMSDEEDEAPGNKEEYSINDDLILPDDEDEVGSIEELPEDLLSDDIDEDDTEEGKKEG